MTDTATASPPPDRGFADDCFDRLRGDLYVIRTRAATARSLYQALPPTSPSITVRHTLAADIVLAIDDFLTRAEYS
jgi:hypothetical protein